MQLRALPPADLVAPRVWTSSQSPLTRFWSDVPACIERTVSCEFRNRLDLGAGTNMTPEVQAIARRFGPAVAQWSRIELRDAIERVLRREGLPPIGKEFQAHNERVDAVCEHLLDSGDMPLPTTLASWLRQLASANLIEVWPGSSTDSLFLKNRVAVPPCTSDPFDSLSSRLHQRLGKGAPVGLFTDNHGEVVFDTAFLSWVLRVYAVPVCAFAKSQAVETDCSVASVRALWRRMHHEDRVRVVATGSRVQGNRLDRLSAKAEAHLRHIKAKGGLLIVKGVANLDSMIGLRLDMLFLFAAKGARTSARFEVAPDSLCGLWVPAGKSCHHTLSRFVYQPVCRAL